MKIISIFSALFLFQAYTHAERWFVPQEEVESILRSNTPQTLGELSRGQILPVPEVQNSKEVQARVIRVLFSYGPIAYPPILRDRDCLLAEGYLEILGFETEENKSLVHYRPKKTDFSGSVCPEGSLLMVPYDTLISFKKKQDQYLEKLKLSEEQAEQNLSLFQQGIFYGIREFFDIPNSIYRAPDYLKVNSLNTISSLKDGTVLIQPGESCEIFWGSKLQPFAMSPDKTKVLAFADNYAPRRPLYSIFFFPEQRPPLHYIYTGSLCPLNTLFMISTEELLSFKDRYAQAKEIKEKRNNFVEKAVSKEEGLATEIMGLQMDQTITVFSEHHWVYSLNTLPHDPKMYNKVRKGEPCNVGYGDRIEIIGFYNDLTLLEVQRRSLDRWNLSMYTANCPKGTLFFLSTDVGGFS